jgi:hypothetical protein
VAILHDGFSQASQRRYVKFTDQHGRKFGANIEIKTGDPCGNWDYPNAPLKPPHHCIKVDKTDETNPFKVRIDYDTIVKEAREAKEEYENAKGKFLRSYPNASPMDVEKEVGKEPFPVEPWIAAKQGDAWTLGFSSRVNVKVAGFIEAFRERKASRYEEEDFTSEDNYADIEEDADKDAIGGKRIPVGQRKKPIKDAEAA